MGIEFVRIEMRADNLVAVFREYSEQEFCLNEENLRVRIANVEGAGRDASTERAALAEMISKARRSRSITERTHG